MPRTTIKNWEDHITPLRMNGLKGRMLYIPPPKRKKKDILLIYGHHASLERMFGLAEELNRYGSITIPDLPGFGGMESFYKIGEKPTLDNFADYLAAFVKLRYKRKRVHIIAISFGFPIVVRMLQKYPELAKKVDLIVSGVGFTHKNDLTFKSFERSGLKIMSIIGSRSLFAWLIRHTFVSTPALKAHFNRKAENHDKLKDANIDRREQLIDMEIWLWQNNDLRTWMYTIGWILKMDLCNKQVDLPLYHVGVRGDRYISNQVVEQHMRVIFHAFTHLPTKLTVHAPTVIATAKEAAPFIPDKLRKILSKS